jgi:hypothetical protein
MNGSLKNGISRRFNEGKEHHHPDKGHDAPGPPVSRHFASEENLFRRFTAALDKTEERL